MPMHVIKSVFCTPILVRDWGDSADLNQRLSKIILEKEAKAPAVQRSNIGSWDSNKDFLEWPYTEIQQFKAFIVEAVREITFKATKGKYNPKPEDMFAHAWANVSRADSYWKIHNHESCTWSGVYYVKSRLVKEKCKSSGNIEFLDPRMLCIATELPDSNFGGRVKLLPRAGRMVLFPNWLHHYVNPVEDKSLRICIAFNVKLETSSVKRRMNTMCALGGGS
ncbi:2OG-Fe(II) oxygenase family protein [Microbulbifer thermotolerans]|uniref:TIGR02466 family protein n=1 Tax=Microbulbifer thermotolerans TaxID=252514 RepID=UPI00224B2DAD|nr:TIGR02466 family protein [Microbulbifer thermotolerans]MCX2781629.1 2OG-Fe(II) oxygenase family protein [Microbulbifer thermotolerans]